MTDLHGSTFRFDAAAKRAAATLDAFEDEDVAQKYQDACRSLARLAAALQDHGVVLRQIVGQLHQCAVVATLRGLGIEDL